MLIDLIPKMANVFNEFMLEYSKKISENQYDASQLMKLHSELTNIHAVKAIKLAMEYLNDENIEAGFNDWMKERGFEK